MYCRPWRRISKALISFIARPAGGTSRVGHSTSPCKVRRMPSSQLSRIPLGRPLSMFSLVVSRWARLRICHCGSMRIEPRCLWSCFRWETPIQSEYQWSELADETGLADMAHIINSSITMLRGDGHVDIRHGLDGNEWDDCLHNCFPGPPDWWNLLL